MIKGKRVCLEEGLKDEHYPLLLQWFHDLEVMKYVGWVRKGLALKTAGEVKSFISQLEGRNAIIFSIYANDNTFIGYTSFCDFKGKEECEYGIFIFDKNYQGRGIGTEVTNIMLKYAFEQLGVEKVILTTSEFHQGAIKLYEKAGFRKSKLIPNDRTIYHDGKWVLSGTVEMEIKKEV